MSDRFDDFKTEKQEITMLVAPSIPAQIDVDYIGREAFQGAFSLIHELLAERGFKCSGDMMPDEARALDKLFQMFVRSVLVNRLDPRIDRGFRLVGVEACEPYELSVAEGVEVEITGTMGPSSHCPTVTVTATTHEKLVDYVRDNWGDDGDTGGWFSEVVESIEEFGAPERYEGEHDDCPVDVPHQHPGEDAPDRLAVATAAYEKVYAVESAVATAAPPRLVVKVDGAVHSRIALRDGDDNYNRQTERVALDCAYEVKEHNPGSAVTIAVETLPADQPRTILIHLNVEVPRDDPRSADEIITLVEGALDVGLGDGTDLDGILVDTALAEEV